MATKYKELVKAATLTATATSLYTAPALTSASIHAASVNNPTGAAVQVNFYKGAVGNATTRIAGKNVLANATAQFPELVNHKLEPGTQIWADGLACNVNVSGVEYVPE